MRFLIRKCIYFRDRFLVHNTILNGFLLFSPYGVLHENQFSFAPCVEFFLFSYKTIQITGGRLSVTISTLKIPFSQYVFSSNFSHAQSFFIQNNYCVSILNREYNIVTYIKIHDKN